MKKSTMIGIGIGAGALIAGAIATVLGKKQDQAETDVENVEFTEVESDVETEE